MKKRLFYRFIPFALIFTLGFVCASYAKSPDLGISIRAFPIIDYKGFKLAYDSRNKIPLYTHEKLSRSSLEKLFDRRGFCFSEDPNIYPLHRSSLVDYKGSGFDRGHMVAAANQISSKQHLQETFYLSNICPQDSDLNRKFWAKLERAIRKRVHQGESLEVITGPLFLPYREGEKEYIKYEVIGPHKVAVPTHFFKLIRSGDSPHIIQALVVPNKPVDSKLITEHFEVPLEELERLSGLQFSTLR